MDARQVGHHGTHHATGQTATEQQRRGNLVLRLDEITQEVVHELLRERAGFHVGVHVNVGDFKAGITKHGLHRNHVRVDHTPREGFHGHIDDVGAVTANLQHGSHREAGPCMSVILNH